MTVSIAEGPAIIIGYEYRLLIMGILMVVLMLFCPNGILGRNGLKDTITYQVKRYTAKKAGKGV